MKRRKLVTKDELKIMLWGLEIGHIAWNDQADRSHFYFSPEYFRMAVDIAPIIAPKKSVESHFAIFGNTEDKVYQKLPPFIADSLPDDWGNTLFDQWFSDNGFLEKDRTPILKLSFIGKRAMGAFEFVPSRDSDFDDKNAMSLEGLYRLASKIEEERGKAVIAPEETLTQKALLAVGTSAGGRFKKAIIAVAPDGSIHSGQISTNPDWKYFIVKFNSPSMCISEIEMTYYEMAKAAGIEMENSDLIIADGVRHFRTERFDRKGGKKLLTMSLAALNPDAHSYEDMFKTCNSLGISEKEKAQLFRRMAFNIMASNTDDHAKNFTFIADEAGKWRLAPAYDINFIFRTPGSAETNHCFSLRGKRSSFTYEDLILFAKEYDIKNPRAVIADIRSALDSFEDVSRKNGVRGDIAETISGRLRMLQRELEGTQMETMNWPVLEVDGSHVENFHFEKDVEGSIRIVAVIDGNPCRKIITEKNEDYLLIADRFNDSPESLKKILARKYFLSKK